MASIVGLRNLYYAPLTSDDSQGTVYGTPVRLPKAVELKITPSTNSATNYGDDAPVEVANVLGDITVEMTTTDMDLETYAALLGHTYKNGVLLQNTSDQAPYVAIGFQAPKSDGTFQYVWIYKVKFQVPSDDFKTQQGQAEFVNPDITGAAVKRDSDNYWKIIGDASDEGFTLADTWFTAVVDPQDVLNSGGTQTS